MLGRTGVGKSSFINAAFGVTLARTDPFEACTKVVEYFVHAGASEICLIDTPGLAEDTEVRDRKYLALIKRDVDFRQLTSAIYVSRLNDTRMSGDEQRSLALLLEQIPTCFYGAMTLVLTFAASVAQNRVEIATTARQQQIQDFVRSRPPCFPGMQSWSFNRVLMVDNVVDNWATDCKPIKAFL